MNLSSTYHPQTDCETERRNRTVEQVLRAFINDNQSNWVELLLSVEFALNSTIQDGTQFSPIEVVSGHRPILPMTFLNAAATQFKSRPLEEFILHRSNAIKAAQDHLRMAQDYMTDYANHSRQELLLNVGDLVFVHSNVFTSPIERSQDSHKLRNMWKGLYRVEKIISPVAYKLHLPRAMSKVHNVFHVSVLKKYVARDGEDIMLATPNPDLIEEPTDDDVVAVLRWRIINRCGSEVLQYLIQLRGQDIHAAHWFDAEKWSHCKASLLDKIDSMFNFPEVPS